MKDLQMKYFVRKDVKFHGKKCAYHKTKQASDSVFESPMNR